MFVQRLKQLGLKRLVGVVMWGGALAVLCVHVLPTRVSAQSSSTAQGASAQTSDEMLREGLEALADRQPDEARQFFQKIIKIYPHTVLRRPPNESSHACRMAATAKQAPI